MSEFQTRKVLIDTALIRVGWKLNVDWVEEFELFGMPNASNVGYADYVLFGDDGRPLAVIEAKRTTIGVSVGRQQAKLYADLLEKKFKRRPVIFLTNGYETRIWDDAHYPERIVSGIYSKRDLEKLFNLNTERAPRFSNIVINDQISNRYYQKGAIKSVCETFEEMQRKALLVMATGSGKTRTVISLVDVLIRNGWVKNVLFLADRTSLVLQAKRAFSNLLPDLSITNLCDAKFDPNARCVFSTYQSMINCIDKTVDETGDLVFTCGHFDLIVVDEAHRSIYNKYRDIFDYFDSLLVGLTATPKDEVDKNTYDFFNLIHGEPTYGYSLGQAVEDEFLVDYNSIETKIKFLEEGIRYDELSEEEKRQYEELFIEDGDVIPEHIDSHLLNLWLFNKDTILRVLDTLMTRGLKVDYGTHVGKTIIFARNHNHAEEIYRIFWEQYPSYPPHFCRVIDNYTNYAQDLIDDFSNKDKMPQIAISVDMLDTGIDVPEILNLVFFKKVFSKSKFWQMIGRGTRLCPGLIDGIDKSKFYIFDFCGNFEFFRINNHGLEVDTVLTLQQRLFLLKLEMIYRLQAVQYLSEDFIKFRQELVDDVLYKIRELNRDNFSVNLHLKYVDKFSLDETFTCINYNDIKTITSEISHLILPYDEDVAAVRFDALLSEIEAGFLKESIPGGKIRALKKKIQSLLKIANIPDVAIHVPFMRMILDSDYLYNAGIQDFEHIRIELRDLMKYIKPTVRGTKKSNMTDTILEIEENESEMDEDDYVKYREKAEYYVIKHQDEEVIKKLKTNIPLDQDDISRLEEILWFDIGSKEDYEAEYGSKPLGQFVREIVGLDMNAAKAAFSAYLDNSVLNPRQLYFVNQIIEYIIHNGMILDYSVLGEAPFTDRGSVVDLFSDVQLWFGIKNVIDTINNNAKVV